MSTEKESSPLPAARPDGEIAPHDPQRLKVIYVHGNDSIRSLAERFGLPVTMLEHYSKKERWVAARREYRNTRDARAHDLLLEYESRTIAEVDAQVARSTGVMLDMLDQQLCDENLKPTESHTIASTIRLAWTTHREAMGAPIKNGKEGRPVVIVAPGDVLRLKRRDAQGNVEEIVLPGVEDGNH
jgi:hypothetical protein